MVVRVYSCEGVRERGGGEGRCEGVREWGGGEGRCV